MDLLPGCPLRPWLDEPLPAGLRKLRRYGCERRDGDRDRVIVSLWQGHRFANAAGYQRRARLVAAYGLGALPRQDEHVDHINGVSDDDRPENLRLLAASYHGSLHAELVDLGGFRSSDGRFQAHGQGGDRLTATRFAWLISNGGGELIAAPRERRGRRAPGTIYWPTSRRGLRVGRECLVREADLMDVSYPLRPEEVAWWDRTPEWAARRLALGFISAETERGVAVRLIAGEGRTVLACQVAVEAPGRVLA